MLLFLVDMKKWHVVYTKPGEKVVAGFVKLMQSQGPRIGMKVDMPTLSALPNDVSTQLANFPIVALSTNVDL
jgi:hypothetical protein